MNVNRVQVNVTAAVMLRKVPRMYQSAQARSAGCRLENLKMAFPVTIMDTKPIVEEKDSEGSK